MWLVLTFLNICPNCLWEIELYSYISSEADFWRLFLSPVPPILRVYHLISTELLLILTSLYKGPSGSENLVVLGCI